MTRLTHILHKVDPTPMQKKTACYPNYPYKQMLPAALRDKVSGRSDKMKTVPCLQETSLMLVCLKKFEFEQSRCSKEVEAFLACNKSFDEAKKASLADPEAILRQSGKLPKEAVDGLLKKYPQPKK